MDIREPVEKHHMSPETRARIGGLVLGAAVMSAGLVVSLEMGAWGQSMVAATLSAVMGGSATRMTNLQIETTVMPMMGAGLFSASAGGMVAAVGSLVGHLLYGAILGTISVERADLQLAHASPWKLLFGGSRPPGWRFWPDEEMSQAVFPKNGAESNRPAFLRFCEFGSSVPEIGGSFGGHMVHEPVQPEVRNLTITR